MTREEIILRRVQGQQEISPVSAEKAAADLCGIQAQFLTYALHALKIRGSNNTEGLIKSWTNRGTMHLFPERELPLFLHDGRSHFLRPVDTMESDAYMNAERKAYYAEIICEAIACGTDGREELKALCERRGMLESESRSAFDPWGGLIRALCEDGRICHKVQEKKAYRLCPEFVPMEREEACLELLRRYFSHFGPATVKDAAAFFAFTQKEIKKLMEKLPLETCELMGNTYFFIGDAPTKHEMTNCMFLAGFDQLLLGYEKKESLIFSQDNLREIYTLSGIVRPVLLVNGAASGTWRLKNRKLEITLFDEIIKAPIEKTAYEIWAGLKEIKFT